MPRLAALLVVSSLLLWGCTEDAPDGSGASIEASPTITSPASPGPDRTARGGPGKKRLRVLGHEDLGGRGFNGDVWALGDYAYMGTYGGKTEDAACPQGGVKVIDISDPRDPRLVARLDTAPNTSAEDVVVRSVDGEGFTGDLAAVGIQACDIDESDQPGTFRGLQFFDVTDPLRPRPLSRWQLPDETPGCHEIDLIARRERVLAGCAAPFAKSAGLDEAYVVDVSDPDNPIEAFRWGLPEGPGGGVGCLPAKVVHNVRFSRDALTLYVSYWDAGTPILDIRALKDPKLMGIVEPVPLDPDGDNHSVAEIPGGHLIVMHEDFSPALPEAQFGGCGARYGAWGPLRIYNIENPARPRLVSEYTTPNMKISNMKTPEIFTAHNAEVVGRDEAVVSWYSDGVRWLDLSNLAKPRAIDTWVPRAAPDPHGFLPTVPLVWGVYPLPERDLIVAGDINSGLWVLEAPGLGDP